MNSNTIYSLQLKQYQLFIFNIVFITILIFISALQKKKYQFKLEYKTNLLSRLILLINSILSFSIGMKFSYDFYLSLQNFGFKNTFCTNNINSTTMTFYSISFLVKFFEIVDFLNFYYQKIHIKQSIIIMSMLNLIFYTHSIVRTQPMTKWIQCSIHIVHFFYYCECFIRNEHVDLKTSAAKHIIGSHFSIWIVMSILILSLNLVNLCKSNDLSFILSVLIFYSFYYYRNFCIET